MGTNAFWSPVSVTSKLNWKCPKNTSMNQGTGKVQLKNNKGSEISWDCPFKMHEWGHIFYGTVPVPAMWRNYTGLNASHMTNLPDGPHGIKFGPVPWTNEG